MAAWNDILKAKLETLLGERGTGKDAALRRGEADALLTKAATLAAAKAEKAAKAQASEALTIARRAEAAVQSMVASVAETTVQTASDDTAQNERLFQAMSDLFQWNGATYTLRVPAAGVIGRVGADQIADAAIGVAKFASGISPVEIVSSLPASGNFQGRTVFLTTDNKLYRYTGTAWISTVPAADITGQLVAGQIADAAITTAKFAAGIEPVEILATLPTTGNFQGRMVFLTTDNKLYRYTGSAFVASVAAGDIAGQVQAAQIAAIEASKITGQLTDAQISDLGAAKLSGQITQTQITDGSISTAKLAAASVVADKIATSAITADKVAANAITAVKIATGAVEAAKIAAGAVTAGTIATDAVTAGKIAAGAVTAGTIAADAVTAGKIAAGAVNVREIAADAITAEKLFIGDASNLVPNAEMTEDGAWSFGSTWYRGDNPTNTAFSSAGAFTYPDDGVSTGWGGMLSSKRFAVESGAKYYARHQSYAATGVTYRVWGRIAWMDTNGALIGGTEGVGYTTIDSSTAAGGGVVTKSSIVTAPVNAKFAQYHFYVDRGTTTGTVLVSGLIVRRASSGELIVDGAITADKIAANTITAAQIATGAITADELAANSVVAGKVAAGAISATEIAAGAVTTEKLAVGSSNNTIHNSQFYGALSGWNATSNSGNTGVMSIRVAGSTWTKPGCPVLQVFQPDGGTVGYVDVRNQRVGETGNVSFGTPVKEGSTWEASAYTSAHRCIVELRIEWRNVSGTTLGYSAVSTNSNDAGSSADPDQWVRLVSRGIAPAGAAYAVFHIRKRATNSGASPTDSFMMVHKPLLGETVPNASVAMEWSPGGWTLISGDAILTGSVNADRIVAGSITATQINAGAIGAEQLAANAVSARHLAVGNFVNLFDGADSFETSPFRPASAAYGGNGIWDTTTTYNGQTSIGINADFGGGTAYVVRDIPVIPGASYYIEFQARRSADWNGAVNNSKLRIANQAGTFLTAIDYSAATVGTSWTKRSLTYTVPSGVTKLRISLTNDATAGWVRLAGFVMRERGGGELLVNGAITADHVDAVSFGASGLALFGGELRSTNFVQGSTGWRIKNDGTAELESLIVRTRHLEDNAVTTLRTATGASTVVSNDFLTTVASLTFTPFGANMVVWLRFTANLNAPTSGTNSLLYQLRWRGVNQISDWVFNVPVGSSLSETVSDMWLIQVPGNTSGTLLLQARTGNSAGGTVSNGLLVVGEFKK